MAKIIKRPIQVFRIDQVCEHCNKGILIATNRTRPAPIVVANKKPSVLIVHVCEHCKAEVPLKDSFPIYQEVVINLQSEAEEEDKKNDNS